MDNKKLFDLWVMVVIIAAIFSLMLTCLTGCGSGDGLYGTPEAEIDNNLTTCVLVDQNWTRDYEPLDGSITGHVVILPGSYPRIEHKFDNNITYCRDWIDPVMGRPGRKVEENVSVANYAWWRHVRYLYCCTPFEYSYL